ncbi:hypothetical protein [Mollivirus kamchatka]|nr:hypothetical protein [Mollivirus kamchatka]
MESEDRTVLDAISVEPLYMMWHSDTTRCSCFCWRFTQEVLLMQTQDGKGSLAAVAFLGLLCLPLWAVGFMTLLVLDFAVSALWLAVVAFMVAMALVVIVIGYVLWTPCYAFSCLAKVLQCRACLEDDYEDQERGSDCRADCDGGQPPGMEHDHVGINDGDVLPRPKAKRSGKWRSRFISH